MNREEAHRIASAITCLRPDWLHTNLLTILAKPEHRLRPAQDIAIALTWLALDPTTDTPGRLNESGPWWPTTTTNRHAPTNTPPRTNPRPPCHECGAPFHNHPTDHRWTDTPRSTPATIATARANAGLRPR